MLYASKEHTILKEDAEDVSRLPSENPLAFSH